MKVLMFGWEFPPFNSGGLGVACEGLTKALSKEGVEILFVLPKKLDLSIDYMKILYSEVPNINFYGVNSSLLPYLTSVEYKRLKINDSEKPFASTLIQEVMRYAKLTKEIIKRLEFDLIHAHDWLSFPAAVEAMKMSNKPLISHVHSTEFDRSGENVNKLIAQIESNGVHSSTKTIAVSNLTKNVLHDWYDVDKNDIEVVHNGIEIDETTEKDFDENLMQLKTLGKKIVLFLGRITMQKGPEYFLRSARRVLDYMPETIFVMAGSGDMEERMIEEAARLGIGDKILFTGFVRGSERDKLFRSADLFVLPSVSEPYGIVTPESLIARTPVIISNQSGVSEVLSHALKVDFWDTEEMANKILSVLQYTPLKLELSSNGAIEAKAQTWDKAAKKTLNIYNKILALN